MIKKRYFQIVAIALFIVGAAYIVSTTFQSVGAINDDSDGSPSTDDALAKASPTEVISDLDPYLPMAVTKEGLTLEVLDYRWVENEALFDVKFPLVDERDWQLKNVYLEIDGKQYPLWATTMVEVVEPAVDGEQVVLRYENGIVKDEVIADTGKAYRIDTLTFGDVPLNLDKLDFMLVIKEISTTPNEGGYCKPDIIKSIQNPMEEAFPGIEIVCISEPGFDGFGIASDSTFVEDAEALSLFDTIVNRVLNARIIGLWQFSFGG